MPQRSTNSSVSVEGNDNDVTTTTRHRTVHNVEKGSAVQKGAPNEEREESGTGNPHDQDQQVPTDNNSEDLGQVGHTQRYEDGIKWSTKRFTFGPGSNQDYQESDVDWNGDDVGHGTAKLEDVWQRHRRCRRNGMKRSRFGDGQRCSACST